MKIGRALLGGLLGGGSDSAGVDSSGAAAAEEERRKAALRRRIDALYGISSEEPQIPAITATPVGEGSGFLQGAMGQAVAGENSQIAQRNVAGASEAETARQSLEAEKTQLGDATRSFHTDALQRSYEKAARQAKFNLARRSVLGGSGEVDVMSELSTDRNLGATRVDDAVRRAISGLETSREQERLNAIQLVNSGAGDSAVTAAQRGLQNAFENQSSQQRADLTSDLFSAGADAATFQNLNDQALAQAALFRDRTSSFFAPRATSGRVTPSA